jgi:hypothetical protein
MQVGFVDGCPLLSAGSWWYWVLGTWKQGKVRKK